MSQDSINVTLLTIIPTDEIAALVLDPGTYVTRSGFAGEDTPKSVIPSNYAFIPQEDAEKYGGKVLPGDNAVNSLAENLEIRNVMSEGIGTQCFLLILLVVLSNIQQS